MRPASTSTLPAWPSPTPRLAPSTSSAPAACSSASPPRRPDGFADRAASAGIRLAPETLVEPDGHGLAELARLVDAGELSVHLDRVFPLNQAAQAHAHAENSATGKTVLRIAD